MNKIYIVTKGDYSDYHIIACFTDKDKAALCARMYSDSYDEAQVEEYDIKDNNFISKEKQLTFFANADITNLFENVKDSVACIITGPLDTDSIKGIDECEKTTNEYVVLDNCREDDKIIIRIKKCYANDRYTYASAEEHFRKFLYDLITKVKSYILEGADKNSLYYLIKEGQKTWIINY